MHASSTPKRDRRGADVVASLDALRRVFRLLRVSAGRTEEATGLSAAQLFVLEQVAAAPGQSLTELAARTLTDRTSVSAVVDRLVARGLVERGRTDGDRRRVAIHATAAGAATLARAPHPPTRAVLDGFDQMGDRSLHQLALGLAGLCRAMGIAEEPAGMMFEDPPPRARRGARARRAAAPREA